MNIVRKKPSIPLAVQCFPHCLFLPQSGEDTHSHFLILRDFHFSDASESQIFLKIAYAGKKRRNLSFSMSSLHRAYDLHEGSLLLHVHFIDY